MRRLFETAAFSAIVALTASCHFCDDYEVDFTKVGSADPSWFSVVGSRTTSMNGYIPQDCYLPDGTALADYEPEETKTTSSTPANLVQNLLDFGYGKKLTELHGTYMSVDEKGNPIRLSGKVVLPADGRFSRYIIVSHYTIGSNKEAPSNCFPLEGVLAPLGYCIIVPDYLGYGVTYKKKHPYLAMDLTARNVMDMYDAVIPFMEAAGLKPQFDDVYLMGYSQGGATTMAVQRLIETEYVGKINIRRVFAGGGPYDVTATYDHFVSTNHADYPCAVPLVIQGMQVACGLDIDLREFTTPLVYENLDEWFNSKHYTTAQMNGLLGTKVTSDLISEKGRDRTSAEVAALYKAMNQNSIVQSTWMPQAPVYMMHSMDDETVNFINAVHAKSIWNECNIVYNFGHYGNHVKTTIRFIYTVQKILQKGE